MRWRLEETTRKREIVGQRGSPEESETDLENSREGVEKVRRERERGNRERQKEREG